MKRVIKWISAILLVLIMAPVVVMFYLYNSADMGERELVINPSHYTTHYAGDTLYCQDSYLRHDQSGLWEFYITGSGQHKGAKQGALTQDLLKYQEDVFIDQIKEIIPSDSYLSFLRIFIVIFNRDLGRYISPEYRDEIAAISEFCTDEYNAIGTPYQRQLNYHAAHDIGHTMQQYMLVGCSSFGAWGSRSADGGLIVGRNFDFFVGEPFAKNKVITFATPDRGYSYASVGWAGMVGVLSGMNAKGITVTINAAKGEIPLTAAMPISILAREILQYASTIDEAYTIAQRSQTFVSESLLIGSQIDNECAVIEKTPHKIALYRGEGEQMVCTNHYQSELYATDSYNIENIEFSDSQYRYDRLSELLDQREAIDYEGAIEIMRNRYGKGGKDIGIGNEMTINQSIAHHSVIFKPGESLMWVSTSPWQSGEYICYDLNEFFEGVGYPKRLSDGDVEADREFLDGEYDQLLKYRSGIKVINKAMRSAESSAALISCGFVEQFSSYNPNHYYTYRIAGDLYAKAKQPERAVEIYRRALRMEIPYKSEREEIERIITKLTK